ncbi:GH1 family beta-glucosidase [Oharaeibacter diazotrophicus]|uniref:Beta-glucosidase n=1 Tax=Oharaeibacter diazotrophicus TaxID=1920512 RepID=A0A4R6R6R3_9HYPH|nr:GH1 family beta-glucosidase [Oharaeibacter diazotrophicus]TDP81559.1 beta-glucosidase [Oharaeibacter diazotrophicus]BBE73797.1 beta-glucosidase A [Pleomorphomonas sp. SM30]GLS75588.1 beta-glucosidase [Oharaeibacter diazotrophicus]
MTRPDLAARLPADFVFGVATAAYQIEGSVDADGRAPSIWDAFSRIPGRVVNGDTGDVACDHYRRWRGDVDLIASLGVDAYRFSVAWPRVVPDGRGAVAEAGLAFYDRLVDALLEKGVRPYATLYHWDLPIAQFGRGGWCARDTAHAFADYADVVARRLGDRLAGVMTLNEPWCAAFLGHLYGVHAPGERSLPATLAAVHTLNLAHGLATAAVRAAAPGVPVGIVLNAKSIYPSSDTEADRAAAERYDAFHNGVFAEPIFAGRYPAAVVEALGPAMPEIRDGDLAAIAAPLDFLGINYYTPDRVHADPTLAFPAAAQWHPPKVPRTAMGWEIAPEGLTHLLADMARRWRLPPVYVTENGAAFDDAVVDGRVDDPDRLAYVEAHLHTLADAIDAGVDVRGYFAWSLMDNYEWAEGYAKRFGIVHVDYDTQVRTPKASALWFRDLANAVRARRG